MNTQTELAQIDTEISELQVKLVKAQERPELLASVKPACDTVLEALDILRLVALSNDFGLAEIATFKAATPEPQKKYNHSDKGRKVRANWNKEHRQYLELIRDSRNGECSVCGQIKWLVRKHPPTCKKCNIESKGTI